MYIDREIHKYVVYKEASILETLRKIETQRGRITFVVSEHDVLLGVVTNGDILRWLTRDPKPDLCRPIELIANKRFLSAQPNATPEAIRGMLEKVLFVPLLDEHRHLVAVVRRGHPDEGIPIADRRIGGDNPCFLIAEIGNNHNGSISAAKELVDAAIEAGADCCKFQMRQMHQLYDHSENIAGKGENLGAEYVLDLLSRFQLKNDELFGVFDYCRARGVIPLCTPWESESVRLLEDYGLAAYKVASADLTNHDLLRDVAATCKPMLCSTGMSTDQEINSAVTLLKSLGASYVLLHCNSTYPAPFADINLAYLNRLGEVGECPVGYSGHERGTYVSVAAVAMGAKVIERHITLDRNQEGSDHKASLLPGEFQEMAKGIRQIEQALGSGQSRELSQGELINRVTLAKSMAINCQLTEGKLIRDEMIDVKSPGRGLQPMYRNQLVGTRAKRTFQKGDFFFPNDLDERRIPKRDFCFDRPWGIPVRYHDFAALTDGINVDLVEFHLSYKDLELDFREYFTHRLKHGVVVHSPELFAGDHTLDLCADDAAYREHSIRELQRVVALTRDLAEFFRVEAAPLIIVNLGGFTEHDFLNQSQKREKLKLLAASLRQLDTDAVELIPQTMPPFPWHFGGQRFHNLLVEADEVAAFCEEHGFRICFDVSHSFLACDHHGQSFYDFTKTVAKYTAHLHVADAAGRDGEGLQIGEGELDFPALCALLNKHAPQASFIPEVWQGHENGGEGFWTALERLESYRL